MNTRRYVDGRVGQGDLPSAGGAPLPEAAPAAATVHLPTELRSTDDVRRFMLGAMQMVVNRELDADQVKAICALAQQTFQLGKLELEAADLVGKYGIKIAPMRLVEAPDA